MRKSLEILGFKWRLFKHSDRPILDRIRTNNRYSDLYIYHTNLQEEKMNRTLKDIEQEQSDKSFVKNLLNKVKFRQRKAKLTETMKNTDFRAERKTLLTKLFGFLSLYYESLQSLVQGRREVLNNEQFRFEDKFTVKEKQMKFEELISKFIGDKIPKPRQQSEKDKQ